eukprot:1161266-Pelagomonas_calceolata.AAC.12
MKITPAVCSFTTRGKSTNPLIVVTTTNLRASFHTKEHENVDVADDDDDDGEWEGTSFGP